MCRKMAGNNIVLLLAILALSKSFSVAKSTNTKLSAGIQISDSSNQKDDGSDDSSLMDADERKRCHCDKLTPNSKPDYQPQMQYDRPNRFDLEEWPDKLGISGLPSEFGSSGSISIGSIGSGGGIKYKPRPVQHDSSDSSSSIEPSVPSSTDFVEEPMKKPKPNLAIPIFQIPEISAEPLESKPIKPVSIGEEAEKPHPVKKQVEKKHSKDTVTYSKVKINNTPTKTTGGQGQTCPHV